MRTPNNLNAAPTLTKVLTRAEQSPTLEEAQKFVGGYVQLVRLNDGGQLLVNEEGLMMRLPINPVASNECGQPIVGNALILRNKALWK